jgi:hypothetical protein
MLEIYNQFLKETLQWQKIFFYIYPDYGMTIIKS